MQSEVQEFVDYLRVERGYSEGTVKAYQRHCQGLIYYSKASGIHSFCRLDSNIIYDFLRLNKDEVYKQAYYSLRTFFHFLEREKVISGNILIRLISPKINKKSPVYLTIEEVRKLIDHPDVVKYSGARNKAMMELLYGSGLRVSEATNLKIQDIRHGYLRINGKGSKERIVPFTLCFLDALRYYHKRHREPCTLTPNDYVFTTCHRLPIHINYVTRTICKYSKESGNEKRVTAHTLRHTFAVHLLINGADIQIIQDLLGHSHISTTDAYLQLPWEAINSNFKKYHPSYDNGGGFYTKPYKKSEVERLKEANELFKTNGVISIPYLQRKLSLTHECAKEIYYKLMGI